MIWRYVFVDFSLSHMHVMGARIGEWARKLVINGNKMMAIKIGNWHRRELAMAGVLTRNRKGPDGVSHCNVESENENSAKGC